MTNKDWTAILVGGPRCGSELVIIAPLPELRFPHYHAAEGWNGELTDVYTLERASLETYRARYLFADQQDVLG